MEMVASRRFCQHCGGQVDTAAAFCGLCGKSLTAAAITPSTAPPARPDDTVNQFAVASLVLGILWLYWIGSVLALVFGYVARAQLSQDQNARGGTYAAAGILLGWIALGLLAVLTIVGAFGLLVL